MDEKLTFSKVIGLNQNSGKVSNKQFVTQLATYAIQGKYKGLLDTGFHVSARGTVGRDTGSGDPSYIENVNPQVVEQGDIFTFQGMGSESTMDAWEEAFVQALAFASPGSKFAEVTHQNVANYFQLATAVWATIYSAHGQLCCRKANPDYNAYHSQYLKIAEAETEYISALAWATDVLPIPEATHRFLAKLYTPAWIRQTKRSFIYSHVCAWANAIIDSAAQNLGVGGYFGGNPEWRLMNNSSKNFIKAYAAVVAIDPKIKLIAQILSTTDTYVIKHKVPQWLTSFEIPEADETVLKRWYNTFMADDVNLSSAAPNEGHILANAGCNIAPNCLTALTNTLVFACSSDGQIDPDVFFYGRHRGREWYISTHIDDLNRSIATDATYKIFGNGVSATDPDAGSYMQSVPLVIDVSSEELTDAMYNLSERMDLADYDGGFVISSANGDSADVIMSNVEPSFIDIATIANSDNLLATYIKNAYLYVTQLEIKERKDTNNGKDDKNKNKPNPPSQDGKGDK